MIIARWLHDNGNLRKPRPQRERERHLINDLMTATMVVHVRYN